MAKKQTRLQKLTSKISKPKKSIKLFDSLNLYTRLIADKIDKGLTDKPEEPLGNGQFYYATNRIYTQRGVRKMFFLHSLPSELARGFVSDIRLNVAKAVNEYNLTYNLNEFVHVALVVDAEHYNLDLGGRKVQGRWSYFAKEFERVSKKAEGRSLQDELKSDRYTDNVRRKVNSFLYIKDAKENHDAGFFKTKVILEFWASSNEVMLVAENQLEAYTFTNRIKTKEVFIRTNDYQKSYMPMGSERKTLLRQMNEGDVWADDTISSLSVCTHGTVGDKIGVYHGIDIQSRNVLAIDFSKGEDVNNILLCAGSGEGKSKYAKMLYTFYQPMPEYGTVVFDYEGIDYVWLGKVSGATILSFGEADGSYVNTVVIADLTGNPKVDASLKIEAMEMTEKIFNLLFDENHGMTSIQEALFSDILNDMYLDFGVTNDPKTWVNSKNCTLYHIYAKAKMVRENSRYIQKYGSDTLNEFVLVLSSYFETGATKEHWFKNPISVSDILNTNNVVITFDMAGKGEGSAGVSDKFLALRQMFASSITTLIAFKNRAKGIRTVVFLEELQRYLKQRFSGEIVAGFSTGGRKLGMIVYYITNAPKELIDITQDASLSEEIGTTASKIMGNMSTKIIGALYKHEMNELIHFFSLHNAQGILYELSVIKEQNLKSHPLKHCFFVSHNGQSTVVKMLSHPALAELPLYKTVRDAETGELDVKEMRVNMGDDEMSKRLRSAVEEEKELQRVNADFDSRFKTVDNTWKVYNENHEMGK